MKIKRYEVAVFEVADTILVEAKSKKEAVKKAKDKYYSRPFYDGNEPAKFEIAKGD